jgi:hypothetical protein
MARAPRPEGRGAGLAAMPEPTAAALLPALIELFRERGGTSAM